MMYLLITCISLYAVLLIVLIRGWYSLDNPAAHPVKINQYYSVIIAVRNEESNVAQLIYDLQRQNFPPDRFEIILVNDHSEDATVKAIEQRINISRMPVRLFDLGDVSGKKAALQHGIAMAAGTVVVTTDADCRMCPDWLRTISAYFETGAAEMVCGPVTFMKEDTFFKKLQTIEFASLIGTGAASLALGMPNMCNGANLSFRKASFLAVGGYAGNENIASGDDEFLMHKFYSRYPSRVLFNKSPDGIVYTRPHERWSGFFQQRKRWASKWRQYTNAKTIVLAVFIFLCNLAIIGAVGSLIIDVDRNTWLLIPVLGKFILEALFLSSVLKFFKKKLHPVLFIFLQFTYPFYVILFGIAANFGKYTWKGRKH